MASSLRTISAVGRIMTPDGMNCTMGITDTVRTNTPAFVVTSSELCCPLSMIVARSESLRPVISFTDSRETLIPDSSPSHACPRSSLVQ